MLDRIMLALIEQPEIVVIHDEDVQVTPLGKRLHWLADYEIGWLMCKRHAPLTLCESEAQEHGWWAYALGPATIERDIDADERTMNTIGGF
jgi:hypothetical protein